MQLFVYNDESYEEYQKVQLDRVARELADPKQVNDVLWLNVHGLHQTDLISDITKLLGLKDYITTDILNTQRRTRVDEMDGILFFSIKSLLEGGEDKNLQVEQ